MYRSSVYLPYHAGLTFILVDLTPFGAAVASTLSLYQDKVDVASKAGVYRVAKYVYRAVVPLQAGQILGNVAGVNGSGPGGIEALVSLSVGCLQTSLIAAHSTKTGVVSSSSNAKARQNTLKLCTPCAIRLVQVSLDRIAFQLVASFAVEVDRAR